MATIRYLQQHKNNISGRVAEIRDEILEAVGATAEEIPFIGELIRVKDMSAIGSIPLSVFCTILP